MSFLETHFSRQRFLSRRLGQEKGEEQHGWGTPKLRRPPYGQRTRGPHGCQRLHRFHAKPFVEFQTSMMHLFAENMEQAARNYERSFEAVSNIIAQQRRDAA
jgi:hypothetical protein